MFKSLEHNEDWIRCYRIYKKNKDELSLIENRLKKQYNFTSDEATHSILHEIYSINYTRKNRTIFSSFSKIKWLIIYISLMFGVFMSAIVDIIITPFQKKINTNILYEEMWDMQSWYSRFYIYIDKQLKNKKYQSDILYIHPGYTKDIFTVAVAGWNNEIINRRYKSIVLDYKKVFLILRKDFIYFFKLYSLSKNINIIFLYLRILKKMLLYSSQVKKLKADILVGAGDYYWNPIKYIEYKRSIKNIILIQHNFKNEYLHNRLFQYCDFYFAHSQNAIDKLEGIDFSKKYSVGSFQLVPFIAREECEIEYDILFINQTVEDDLTNAFPTLNQYMLRDSFYTLINNFKKYLEKNQQYKSIYVAKGNTIDSNPSLKVKNDFIDVPNIKFIGAYGSSTFDLVKKSKLIINMYSSVGFEAYGLDKKVLWINYNRSCDMFKYNVEEEDLHVMINDNSYEAFEERVNLLLSDNKEVDEHYKKLKKKFMNIQENPAKIVANKINEILEESQC